MDALRAKVTGTIEKHGMFAFGERILAAVSGGPDSVALLHLLCDLRGDLGLHVEVSHLQHGIREEEGREDALFVARMAHLLGLPFHLKDVNLPKMKSERGKGNLEGMAREERYRFFADLARDRRLSKIATAHTRDDQVETLLMWLVRGSGRKGLSGMPIVSRLGPDGPWVVRPLMDVSKTEILAYLKAHGLEYRGDRTNLDLDRLRNWLRLRLLPQLRQKIDPSLDERLAQLAAVLREEDEILEGIARDHLQGALKGEDLVREPFLAGSKAIQRRALRLWLEERLGNLGGVGFGHVEEALRLIAQGPPQARLSLPKGWNLARDYEAVRLEKRGLGVKASCYSYVLPLEGELFVAEAGLRIESRRSPFVPGLRPKDKREAVFDLSSLPENLTVRNFRAGDRFQPLGMHGHKKLKDLFIEKKVPLSVRRVLPLLLAGGEILWIPGCGRSEVARVGPETREVLRVRLVGDSRDADGLNILN